MTSAEIYGFGFGAYLVMFIAQFYIEGRLKALPWFARYGSYVTLSAVLAVGWPYHVVVDLGRYLPVVDSYWILDKFNLNSYDNG